MHFSSLELLQPQSAMETLFLKQIMDVYFALAFALLVSLQLTLLTWS